VFFKSLLGILQLHELRFAKGSPIGRAEKEKNGSARSPQRFIRLFTTKLIKKRKCRGSLASL
jgi:hypothetical protein